MIKLALILLLAASLNAMPKNFEDPSPNQQGNQDQDDGRANPPNRGTNEQHRHAAAAARLPGNRAANQDALDYDPMENQGEMDPDRVTGIGTSRRRRIPNAVGGGGGPSTLSRDVSSSTQGASAGRRLNFRLELPTEHYPEDAPPVRRGNSISAQNQGRMLPVQPALTMIDLQQANTDGYRMVTDPRTGRQIPSVSSVEANRRARGQQQQGAGNDLRQDQEYNGDEDEEEYTEDWQVDGYDDSPLYQGGNNDFDPPQGGTGIYA
ncbi:hypothetical protein MIR68_006302 [Amoeboaphelidium protococcarum]|nr:hypothetical protein MIR68_006302 [Amoeboaphelidium protococcarum]